MPYIDRDTRLKWEESYYIPENVGELTYAIQQLLRSYTFNGTDYQTFAECLGALEGAKADFVDRVLLPYEAKKCEENGDVWT